jgi:uncharacterized metal-binding protein YceD (DUF177 family)
MAQFDGKVSIREVERKVFEMTSDQSETWIKTLLAKCAPQEEIVGLNSLQWAAKSLLTVDLRVEKVGGDYLVSGHFEGSVPTGCSRCGDPCMVPRSSDFRVLLVPGSDPLEDVSDDPDYVFFYSDDIDLISVLSEQIIVLECSRRFGRGPFSPDCRYTGTT